MVNPRRLTFLCYGAMMSLAIGLNLLPVFLLQLSTTLGGAAGLSSEQLGRLGAVTFAGLVVGIIFTGKFADRYGIKLFTQLGNAITALGLALMAYAPTYSTMLAALFLVGLAGGMLDMVLSPILSALNPERRAHAMNWLHSYYSLGAAVTIITGMVAIQLGFGWQTTCLVLIALPVTLLIGFAPLHFPSLQAEGSERMPLRGLLRKSWFFLALVAIFLGGATELGIAHWLPAYAEGSLGFPPWIASSTLLAFSLAMAAGRMTCGILSHRVAPLTLLAWSCATSVFLFLGLALIPQPVASLACCIVVGFTASALWPTVLAITADNYPNGGATMYCALSAVGNAGGIFMPWAVGWTADQSNLSWGLAASAFAPLLMLPLFALMKRRADQS